MIARINSLTKITKSDLHTTDIMLTQGHTTSVREIKYFYEIINKHVFESVLQMPQIQVRRLRGSWGMCEGHVYLNAAKEITGLKTIIVMNKKQLCPQLCLVNLAHEMVHQYQWQILGQHRLEQGLDPIMSHGPSFFSWRKRFNKFGIPLKIGHSALKIAYYQNIWAH